MVDRRQMTLGLALGAGAGAMWGLVFLAPELLPDFGALQLTAGRFVAYGLIAAILLASRWASVVKGLSLRDWWVLSLLAVLANTLYYALLATAVRLGGIAMASLVIGFVPVLVTLIGSRDRDAVPLKHLAPSLLFSLAGAACIGFEAMSKAQSEGWQLQALALVCAVGALVSWAVFAVQNSRALKRLTSVSSDDWSLLIGVVTGAQGLILAPFALLLEPSDQALHLWGYFALVSLGLGLFSSVLGYALWNRMSRILPLTMVGQMVLFETLFALIYAFVWAQRLPSPYEVGAMILVCASVMSCVRVHGPKPAAH